MQLKPRYCDCSDDVGYCSLMCERKTLISCVGRMDSEKSSHDASSHSYSEVTCFPSIRTFLKDLLTIYDGELQLRELMKDFYPLALILKNT
jgi:hypothetical protein